MENKPDPALLRPSNLSNEIKKWVPISHETIPLTFKNLQSWAFPLHASKNKRYSIIIWCLKKSIEISDQKSIGIL
jgi:hypothetical protein